MPRERMILKNPKDQEAEDRYLLIQACTEAAVAEVRKQGHGQIFKERTFEMWSVVEKTIRKYEELNNANRS